MRRLRIAVKLSAFLIAGGLYADATAAEIPPADHARLDRIEQSLKADVPRVLCLDENITTGAQPTEKAYTSAAANGFRSVLSLRTASEGIDIARERAVVEKTGMRYLNIPVVSSAPRSVQADEFIKLVQNKANHPMLIVCASANRVGAFMMIYRVIESGWSEDKALEEASKIGLRSEELKQFSRQYIARHKSQQ
jgi:protein tyrosine phosphatase (PTP) superfamily phosphohydrolase (DUF442 family)